ncbi:hypothetical protein [Pseudomonas sp. B392_1p]|uniref:hypothetical protein n=1 Tax=Pseudomonas sp. B392_1p TaxID=3457507 RepID=UPI003FD427C6
MPREYFIIVTNDQHDIVRTDVQHLITNRPDGNIHLAPEFKFGYAGSGPNELAANILWLSEVPEIECTKLASKFRDEVMHKELTADGKLYYSVIEEWLTINKVERSAFHKSTPHVNA